VQPLLRDPIAIETPHRLLAEVEPPIIRIGPCTECSTDFHMHGPIGVGGFLCALALRVVMVVLDGFEMPGALVFFVQRVIAAHIARPRVALVGLGHQVCHAKVTNRSP
jgi:hypothetical protein